MGFVRRGPDYVAISDFSREICSLKFKGVSRWRHPDHGSCYLRQRFLFL